MTLETEMENIADDEVVIVTADPERYREVISTVVRVLSRDGKRPGIYLTANLPHQQLIGRLEADGVPTADILFLDAVTESRSREIAENAIGFDSPANLTSLSIALTNAVDEMGPEKPFLLIDSLTTLSMYNPTRTLTAFFHHLTGRSRDWGLTAAVIAVEGEAESELMANIRQMCDRVIEA